MPACERLWPALKRHFLTRDLRHIRLPQAPVTPERCRDAMRLLGGGSEDAPRLWRQRVQWQGKLVAGRARAQPTLAAATTPSAIGRIAADADAAAASRVPGTWSSGSPPAYPQIVTQASVRSHPQSHPPSQPSSPSLLMATLIVHAQSRPLPASCEYCPLCLVLRTGPCADTGWAQPCSGGVSLSRHTARAVWHSVRAPETVSMVAFTRISCIWSRRFHPRHPITRASDVPSSRSGHRLRLATRPPGCCCYCPAACPSLPSARVIAKHTLPTRTEAVSNLAALC